MAAVDQKYRAILPSGGGTGTPTTHDSTSGSPEHMEGTATDSQLSEPSPYQAQDSERMLPRKRNRVGTQVACDSCRRRKARCTGRRPKCEYCENQGRECIYDDQRPRWSVRRHQDNARVVKELLNTDSEKNALAIVEQLREKRGYPLLPSPVQGAVAEGDPTRQPSSAGSSCVLDHDVRSDAGSSNLGYNADMAVGGMDGFLQPFLPMLEDFTVDSRNQPAPLDLCHTIQADQREMNMLDNRARPAGSTASYPSPISATGRPDDYWRGMSANHQAVPPGNEPTGFPPPGFDFPELGRGSYATFAALGSMPMDENRLTLESQPRN